jgi:hypothetical protein
MLRVFFLCAALFAGAAVAAPPVPVELPLEIVGAEFGTFDYSDPAETVFEPTRVIPHRQGQRYGWIIEVRTKRRSLSVSEEYLLPNPAQVRSSMVGKTEVMDIPERRRNQVSQRQLVPVDDLITGEWEVGPSEPAGHRSLQVVVEGQVAAVFEYDVK